MAVVFSVNPNAPDETAIAQAVQVIVQGGLVAFPTETVYGLAANAADPKAIERLNRVKGRPPDKPYSIHIAQVARVREMVHTIPPLAARLMEVFWPGPLTIVMPSSNGSTVGFRCPDHPVARAFLQRCPCPIVAPSANRSGAPPPTDGRDVVASLGEQIECVLDAGPTPLGRESTVVSVVGDRLTILREGAIAAQALTAGLHQARPAS